MLKYKQIADHLRARITEGEFGPGELLPSGRDLCEQFGVSRATVIKAMDILRSDGVVVARQGAGFTVVETPVARPAGQRGIGPRAAAGRPFKRLGVPILETSPPRIADALQIPAGTHALRRSRLILLDDGDPFALVNAWFPVEIADACPRLSQNGPIAEGTTTYVARHTGRSPAQGTDVHTVRVATADEADRLGIARRTPVAVTVHVAYDADGRALVCEEGVTPSELWELTQHYTMGS